MSNLESTLYDLLRERLSEIHGGLYHAVYEGATNEEINRYREKVKHCIDMLDIVYGATKDGDLDGE